MRQRRFVPAVSITAVTGIFAALAACQPPDPRQRCLQKGLKDLMQQRSVEPRLSAGLAWEPCEKTLPKDHLVEVAHCPTPHQSASIVSIGDESCDAAGNTHLEALRTLIVHQERTDEAVDMLETLFAEKPPHARVLSDLAAANLVRAQRTDRASDLLRALDAAQRAVEMSGQMPEARFNLALAQEALQLRTEALSSWERYLQLDDRSGWAEEARDHQQRLQQESLRAAATEWSLNQQRLDVAVRANDRLAIAQLIAPFPSAAHHYIEDELLPAWARDRSQRTSVEARWNLNLAQAIATELARLTGDSYLSDAVQTIVQAEGPPGDPMRLRNLLEGHLAIAEARLALEARDLQRAHEHYRQATRSFALAGSPLRIAAELGLATVLFFQPDKVPPSRVLADLERIEKEARQRGYGRLLGRVLSLRAISLFVQSRLRGALTVYDDTLANFKAMNDDESFASILARKAGVWRILGQHELAWRAALEALKHFPQIVELQSQHHLLGEAAASALALGLPRGALLYQDRVVRLIQDALSGTPAAQKQRIQGLRFQLAIALRERAAIEIHGGRGEQALTDLDQASGLAAAQLNQNIQRALQAQILEVQGTAAVDSEPQKAIELLTQALDVSPLDEYRTLRASILFQLARAYRKVGSRADAERNLKLGIEELRAEEKGILAGRKPGQGEELWTAYFSRFQEAYQLLIRLLAEEGRHAEAFSYAERARAFEPLDLMLRHPLAMEAFRRLAAQGEPLELGEIQSRLPHGTFLIEHRLLEDRLLTWLVWRQGFELLNQKVESDSIKAWMKDLQTSASQLNVEEFEGHLSAFFHALVGTPLARIEKSLNRAAGTARLVFIPDEALQGLPFAALRNPKLKTGGYLIEDFSVSVAPSATLYIASRLRDAEISQTLFPHALLIGDPAFDPDLDLTRGLERLPRALTEVDRINQFYHRADVFTDKRATVDAFLALTPPSAVVHFAGHSVANPTSPIRSFLLLAPSKSHPGTLFAEELLTELQLEQTRLFVLAACSSAGGHPIGPEGLGALVRPLIATGVPAVVGSLWNVGDDATEQFFVEFHRRYTAGKDAADALREAQLAFLQGENAARRAALAWAPFQLIGHASAPIPHNDPN